MSNITVSSSAELLSALAAASSGDTIMLAPGSYAGLSIRNLNFPEGVTVSSADPANPAKIMDLAVRDSSGLTFTNLEFDASGDVSYYEFAVYGSNNIHFKNVHVHGSLDGDPHDDESAFIIRNSTNVSVQDSEFEQLWHGINHIDSDGLLFSGNSFHDMRTDGIRGGGSSNVTITGNSFTNFYLVDGDHGDAIQFWTTNTTTAVQNIVVADNVITRGDGGIIQGIFLRDEVGGLPYENVTITNNMLVGTLWNGICIQGGINVRISDNIVASLPDQLSRIRLEDVSGAVLTNNSAGAFLLQTRNTDVSSSGSSVILPTAEQAQQLLNDWLAENSGGTSDPEPGTTDDTSVRSVFGTQGDDQMEASGSTAIRMAGLSGNDSLTDSASLACWLEGGAGDDVYFVNGSNTTVVETLGEGVDTVHASVDICLADQVEALELEGAAVNGTGNGLDNVIRGTGAHNVLYGLEGDDQIFAALGDDKLEGGIGNDLLDGGAGNDVLRGGAGADILVGGSGEDLLYGGEGRDVFVYSSDDIPRRKGQVDIIMDYSGDLIDLSSMDARARTKANDAFTFIGDNAFTKEAGQLRTYTDGKNTYVSGDLDGNGVADFEIRLIGVHDLTYLDFVL